MKKRPTLRSRLVRRFFYCLALASISFTESSGADPRYQPLASPGGISPTPDIVSTKSTNNQVTLQWNGFAGPYQVEYMPELGSSWQAVGPSTQERTTTIPGNGHHGIYRVRGAAPGYAGSESCTECHSTTHANWNSTGHSKAHDTLAGIGMGANASCVKCHTVGFGVPTGFTTIAQTPYFAGVQCESCHGPSAAHVMDENNLAVRPIITRSANLCGGCHEGEHHPTFSEWSGSLHSRVDPHVQEYFKDPKSGTARMNSCGACHSGAVRDSMMDTVAGKPLQLPTGSDAASIGITCSTCHSSHPSSTSHASLRHPQFSTNFFTYNTGTNTTFAAQYQHSVQLCGQCHNSRNASINDTSRPPHHSPQYNVLIGDIGSANGATIIHSAHTRLEKQCSSCHTHRHEPAEVTAATPVNTGHSFAANTESCVSCHQTAERAESMVANTQADIKARIQELKALLDAWGETKAPETLRTKYGKLAWEYNVVGQISNPSGASMSGPTSAEQAAVPADIKKARMWVYMVEHDGSFGVHNPKYARYLLGTAKTNVTTLLEAP